MVRNCDCGLLYDARTTRPNPYGSNAASIRTDTTHWATGLQPKGPEKPVPPATGPLEQVATAGDEHVPWGGNGEWEKTVNLAKLTIHLFSVLFILHNSGAASAAINT